MKRVLSFMIVLMCCSLVHSQLLMRVEKIDGTIVEYQTTDVKRVFFETAESPTPTIAVPEIVDLGLSVKWASFNVGATKAEEFGGYYSWGETEVKENYSAATYLYNNIYLGPCISGSPLDVANVKLGHNWRLPTSDEFYELYSQCTWTWTNVGGVQGFKIIGPSNNYIFLPSAGYYRNNELYDFGDGCYMSGTSVHETQMLYLTFNKNRGWWSGDSGGENGYTVRAVYDDSNASANVSVSTMSAEVASDCNVVLKGEVNGVRIGTSVGFILGRDASVSLDNGEIQYLRAKDTFSTTFFHLDNATTYYYRAFAYVNGNYIFGEVKSFTTPAKPSAVPEAVDLGLSVKWASFNVGASKPEECGSYYTSSAVVEEVRALWGTGWRLPTLAEAQELTNSCSRIWLPRNGVPGLELRASNGNSIFLPAAGSLHGTQPDYVGEDGNYITSGNRYLYFSVIDHKVGYEDDRVTCSIRLVYDDGDDTPETPVEEFSCPDANHPHMIDLGLPSGTLWACCNVGASAPEDYGNYYAWGETQPKSSYISGTYQYGSSWDIGNDIGGTGYDAATANWGASWRMPSGAQIEELRNNTTSSWTTQNGVNGRMFTGSNGTNIFLPAAGYRWDGVGSVGFYWSSTLYGSSPSYAWNLHFNSGGVGMDHLYGCYFGFTVRPVRSN